MDDPPFVDRILAEVRRRLPATEGLAEEVEHNLRGVLSEAIGRLDLITRDEFEAQEQVLARTRERLETLEQEVAELERQLGDQ